MECSSSLVPHSFSSSIVSVGHVLLLIHSRTVSGQLISTCSGVCGLCPQSQRGVLPIFSLCMCALRRQWPVPKFRKIISTTSSLASDCRDWRAARQSLRIIMLLFIFLSMRILVASRIAWSSALKLDASLATAKECDEDVVSGY